MVAGGTAEAWHCSLVEAAARHKRLIAVSLNLQRQRLAGRRGRRTGVTDVYVTPVPPWVLEGRRGAAGRGRRSRVRGAGRREAGGRER